MNSRNLYKFKSSTHFCYIDICDPKTKKCIIDNNGRHKHMEVSNGDLIVYVYKSNTHYGNNIFLHLKSGKLVDCNEHYYEKLSI